MASIDGHASFRHLDTPCELAGAVHGWRPHQNVVNVPPAHFIEMLTYRAELVSIQVRLTKESSTSKASLLDADTVPVSAAQRQRSPTFSGLRVKRGFYQAASGRRLTADVTGDVTGAYNVIRKVLPNAVGTGVADAPV